MRYSPSTLTLCFINPLSLNISESSSTCFLYLPSRGFNASKESINLCGLTNLKEFVYHNNLYNNRLLEYSMPQQDAEQIKERIVFFLRKKGASLPVHIAKDIQANSLFTSAFLSELYSEKRIRMSDMRVGSSPVYYLPGQDYMLERFSEHLKSKEKDAFALLKERKFLRDEGLHPAIRVALRAITDFAIPFHRNSKIYWRYYLVPEAEFTEEKVTQIVQPKIEVAQEKPEPSKEIKVIEPIEEKIEIIVHSETNDANNSIIPSVGRVGWEQKEEPKPEK